MTSRSDAEARQRITVFDKGFAWAWLAGAALACWALLPETDFSWFRFGPDATVARGIVTESYDTGTRIGGRSLSSRTRSGRPIYANEYEFTASDGKRRSGISDGFGRLTAGADIEVEHLPGNPDVSRIRGMLCAPVGPEGALVLVFAAAGLALVARTLRRASTRRTQP